MRSSMTNEQGFDARMSVLPHNEITSPVGIEEMLNNGRGMTPRERGTAMKRRKRVSIKKDGNLINQISLDILMDNNSDSAERHE